jgi:hypothetical protein
VLGLPGSSRLSVRLPATPTGTTPPVERDIQITVQADDQVALGCPACGARSTVDYHIIVQGHRALVCPACNTPGATADMLLRGNPEAAAQLDVVPDPT